MKKASTPRKQQADEPPARDGDIRTLADVLADLAVGGDEPAVRHFTASGTETTTRSQLERRLSAVAADLSARGVSPGDRVAVCGDASADWIVIALAVIRVGAVLTPIDAQMNDRNLAETLRDSAPRLLYTDDAHRRRLDHLDLSPRPPVEPLEGQAAPHDASPEEAPPPPPSPQSEPGDDAVLFYTSGTTGPPKGVPLAHGNLAFQIRTIREARLARAGDRLLLSLPLHHVYPFVTGLLAPLAVRASIVIPRALTGPDLLEALRAGEVTVLIGVPRLYRALDEGIRSQAGAQRRLAGAMLNAGLGASVFLRQRLGLHSGRWLLRPLHQRTGRQLRLLASGGSALDPDLGRRLEGMGWDVAVGYGLTETAPLLTIRRPDGGPLESVGRPVPHVELRIDANEASENPPDGSALNPAEGEILARGPGVFRGYRGRPEATEKAFTADGWFRTGDLGRIDDRGFLHVTGRVSTRMVMESGENIQPEELEARYETHPLIEEIGILQRRGRLVGLAVPSPEAIQQKDQTDPAEAVVRAVNDIVDSLPSYARLLDVRTTREPLPRTRLGKIRRHLLEERYDEAAGGSREGEPPVSIKEMTEADQALLEHPAAREVWEWLRERFPRHGLRPETSPRMDLGVDSMEWLNLTLEIRNRTGAEIRSEAIERIATIRDLLRETAESAAAETGTADPVEAPYEVLSDRQQTWLQPLGPMMHATSLAAYSLARLLLRLLFSIRVTGRENVPEEAACVLTPNHTSYLDPFVLGYALGRDSLSDTYWAGMTTAAFNTRVKRFGARLGRGVPINPQHGAISGLAFAAAILRNDRRLVWFPEGRRSPDGKLLEFKPGLGKVLERIPTTVVPVWIDGAIQVWPLDRRLPRPGEVSVTFGPAVAAETLLQDGRGDRPDQRILDALRQRLSALSDRVRQGETAPD